MIKIGQTTTQENKTMPFQLTNDGDIEISLNELKGNTTQSGTPTPTSPQQVNVVKSPNLYTGGDISITTSWYFQDKLLLRNFENNAIYTISFDIQATREPFQISIGYGGTGFQADGPTTAIDRTSGHQSFTFQTSNDTYTNLWMRIPRYATQDGEWSASITNIQLERGAFETTPHNSMICKVIGKNIANPNNLLLGKSLNNGASFNNMSPRTSLFQNPIKPSTNYVAKVGENYQIGNIFYCDINMNALSSVSKSWNNTQTFTSPSDAYYVSFATRRTDEANMTQSDLENLKVQLEIGTTATTYEAYKSNNYPITLGDIELCKIGTYQDYIYKEDGSWYLHKEIGKVVLDGSHSGLRTATQTSGNYRMAVDIGTNILSGDANLTAPIYSDKFIGINRNQSYAKVQGIAPTDPEFNYKSLIIYCDATKNMTYAEFQTWLSTNNVLVYYVLATPTTTEITDDTLLEQLEAIGELYRGTNNIMITDTIAPVENIMIEKSQAEFDLVPYIKREPKLDYIDRKGDTGYTADGHYFENIIARKRGLEFELIPMSQDNYLSVISHFIDKTQIPVYLDDVFTGQTELLQTYRKTKIPTKQITENGTIRGTTIQLEEI